MNSCFKYIQLCVKQPLWAGSVLGISLISPEYICCITHQSTRRYFNAEKWVCWLPGWINWAGTVGYLATHCLLDSYCAGFISMTGYNPSHRIQEMVEAWSTISRIQGFYSSVTMYLNVLVKKSWALENKRQEHACGTRTPRGGRTKGGGVKTDRAPSGQVTELHSIRNTSTLMLHVLLLKVSGVFFCFLFLAMMCC